MVTPGRFELPTCGLGNRRSIHLSYGVTDGRLAKVRAIRCSIGAFENGGAVDFILSNGSESIVGLLQRIDGDTRT